MDERQRDLLLKTLHKNKTRKNIYKPNLNVTRNKQTCKNKGDTMKTVECTITESKRRRNNTDILKQSDGVFSQGIGQEFKCSLYDPKSVKSFSQSNEEKEELLSSTNENSVSDDVVLNELSACISDKVPDIKLGYAPLELEKKFGKNLVCDSGTVSSPGVKYMKEGLHTSINEEEKCYHLPFLKEKAYITECPGLFVLKLPNPFVYKNFRSGDQKNISDCQLSSLTDGKIGKLSIKQSGKVVASLGNMKYNLQDITEFLNNYQIVNFNNHKSENGTSLSDLIVLGQTENWYNLIPNQWSTLLSD